MMDCPPLLLLRQYSRGLPRAWREIARLREARGKALPWWPDWCYIPIAGALAVVTEGAPLPLDDEATAKFLAHPPAIVAALAGWRMTKGIYRFDATLQEEIAGMPLEGKLPSEIFYSLPEWCIYVETPDMTFPPFNDAEVEGFFAHLEFDTNDNRSELRLVFFMSDTKHRFVPLHLGDWGVEEAIKRAYDVATPGLPQERIKETAIALTPYINLVLYICSANADYEKPLHPSRTRPRKKKRAAANSIRTWDIGVRLGPALRKACIVADTNNQQEPQLENSHDEHNHESSRTSPRPHWRRGHWHHYWVGPRSQPEKRKLILRWLPPIPVGIPGLDTPVVVRRVKK